MFSELGDLLTPQRRKISPQLLAALQCIRVWKSTGAVIAGSITESQHSDKQLDQLYEVAIWNEHSNDND